MPYSGVWECLCVSLFLFVWKLLSMHSSFLNAIKLTDYVIDSQKAWASILQMDKHSKLNARTETETMREIHYIGYLSAYTSENSSGTATRCWLST